MEANPSSWVIQKKTTARFGLGAVVCQPCFSINREDGFGLNSDTHTHTHTHTHSLTHSTNYNTVKSKYLKEAELGLKKLFDNYYIKL